MIELSMPTGHVLHLNTACPHCGSTHRQVKNGTNVNGVANRKCQDCGRAYASEYRHKGYPPETRLEALRLYLDGINFRRIGRLLGVNHQSVINWVNAYHNKLADTNPAFPNDNPAPAAAVTQLTDTRYDNRTLAVLEGDEIFTFIGSKKDVPTS
jgi:transposase-like protein